MADKYHNHNHSEEDNHDEFTSVKHTVKRKQTERKLRKKRKKVNHLKTFLSSALLILLIIGGYEFFKLPQWYLPQDAFSNPASGRVDVVNNKIVPTLDKRATNIVSRMADIIGYSRAVQDEEGKNSTKLFIRGTARFMAGSRFKYTPDYIDFSYKNLVDAIAEAIDKQSHEDGAEYFTEQRQNLYADTTKELDLSRRCIYTFDYTYEGFIEKDLIELDSTSLTKCIGYPWLINNVDLIKAIDRGEDVPNEYIEVAKKIHQNMNPYRWHNVETQKDLEELEYISGCFHDCYLKSYKGVFKNPTNLNRNINLQLDFDMYQNAYDIRIEFRKDVRVNMELSALSDRIFATSFLLHDGRIYWLEGGEDLRPIDIKDFSHISSCQLRWKITRKRHYAKCWEI